MEYGQSNVPKLDLISALPDCVLVHILSFLPTEDAAKTAVVSKRWQHLWTWVPSLNFTCGRDVKISKVGRFIDFVGRTLIRCSSAKNLKIEFVSYPLFARHVNLWSDLAVRNGVEVLHLKLDDAEFGTYLLPQHLYFNSRFKELHFLGCELEPGGVVNWKFLKNLSIGLVNVSDHALKTILAGSPMLEYLELYRFIGVNRLHISNRNLRKLILRDGYGADANALVEIVAPSLQSLEIGGYLGLMKFQLHNMSSLVNAVLNFDLRSFDEDYQNMLAGLLQRLVHVRNLTLGKWAIQVLSILEVKGIHSPISVQKCLTLEVGLTIKEWCLPGIASLLGSSPNLETLVIDLCALHYVELPDALRGFNGLDYWISSQNRPFQCLMLHLKTMKVDGFDYSFYKLERQLIQFVLKNGLVLEKMVIRMKALFGPMELSKTAEEFLSYPKSSPSAVVRVEF